MAACVARATTFDALDRGSKLETTVDGWPVAALRTYLWAMTQQTTPLFYDDTDTFSCDIYPAPERYSSGVFDVMAQPGPTAVLLGDSTPFSAGRSSQTSSHQLRQARSCNDLLSSGTNPRYSLPSSPRFPPPLARPPTPMRRSQADRLSGPDSASTQPRAGSHRTSDSLDVPTLDHRGRAILSSRPSSRATSPAPSIILTPPQSDSRSRRSSVISLYSSPSTGYTSDTPTSYDAASESESVWSEASDCAKSRPAAVRELVLEMFRDNYKEELKVPSHVLSKGVVEFVSNLYSGSEFLTIDNSEFLPSPLSFRPGAHGYVVPCAWSLYDMLKLQATCNYGGCHIFVTHRNNEAKYYGYYRVIQRDIPLAQWEWLRMPRKMRACIARTYFSDENGRTSPTQERENLRRLDEGEDALYPVFFQFLYYDWDLYHLMTKHTKAREIRPRSIAFASDSSDSSSDVDLPVKRPFRSKPSPLRIVTVDGINFEMAPTPVAWQYD